MRIGGQIKKQILPDEGPEIYSFRTDEIHMQSEIRDFDGVIKALEA